MANSPPRRPPAGRERKRQSPRHDADSSETVAKPPHALLEGNGPEPTPAQTAELARLKAEIEAELDLPETPKKVVTPEEKERRDTISKILWGAVAVLASILALPFVSALPILLLILDVFIAMGFVALLRLLCRRHHVQPGNALIAGLIPMLAIPTLATNLAAVSRIHIPVPFAHTVTWSILLMCAGAALFVLPSMPNAARQSWIAAWGLTFLAIAITLFVALLVRVPPPQPGVWPTFTLTIAIVVLLLAVQWKIGSHVRRWNMLASGPALSVTAAQILDGTVSYLAVGNPFGWLPNPPSEQMAISAFLIQSIGPGYIFAKWGLALVVARILDGPGVRGGLQDPTHRVLLYLVLAYISLGPAIYSTTNLFA